MKLEWRHSKRWTTAIKRPQLLFGVHPHCQKNWCPKRRGHRAEPRTERLLWSHFPDNATVGALAMMCRSSAGSSGMHGDRLYPCCPCQQLNTSISITCFVRGSWGGRAGWGRRTELVELEVQRKHNVPFGAWPAPRCMMEAHLKCCHDAWLSARDELKEKLDLQINRQREMGLYAS